VPGAQRTAVDVGPGAFVELVPDALIPHGGARYRQRTDVELGLEAVVLCTELIAPGRVGEAFAYEELDLRTCVRRDGLELCADVLRLAPATWPQGRWGVVGAHGWLATMLVVAPEHDVEHVAADVDAALAGADGVLGAAAVLPGGCGVGARILGDGGEVTSNALRRAWGLARSRLFGLGLPPRRKG